LIARITSYFVRRPFSKFSRFNTFQITEIFDAISYKKGASVLRMLENFMGAEDFRLGISGFLKRYKYANAVTADLWRELEKSSSQGYNITRIMDTWTRQMGYPVLQVTR
jgi:glutamyl aminopeptidase